MYNEKKAGVIRNYKLVRINRWWQLWEKIFRWFLVINICNRKLKIVYQHVPLNSWCRSHLGGRTIHESWKTRCRTL